MAHALAWRTLCYAGPRGALVLLHTCQEVTVGSVRLVGALRCLHPRVRTAVAAGAATAALIDRQDRRVQNAERVQILPDSHLLALPFAVPPGLFTKKWVLLQTRSRVAPCISSMLMDYDVQERGRERVLLRFRSEDGGSPWQPYACSTWSPAVLRTARD